jgi:hypothetical protein
MIIVDATHAEMDYFEAISSMQGTPSVRFLIDKSSGEIVNQCPAHAEDSITDLEPETRSILGILVYKRRISKEGHLILVGKFFENVHSRSPRKLDLCKPIEEQLLDVVG